MFKKNGDYYDLQRMRTIVFLVHLNVLLLQAPFDEPKLSRRKI